ncbi:MAG: 23S rRNA (guanosine(2251)-2'-O)-methyltransferase RlmB [Pseudomonadota bacterium]
MNKKPDNKSIELIYGAHAVEFFLKSSPKRVKRILITQPKWRQRIQSLVTDHPETADLITEISEDQATKLCSGGVHQGCIIEIIPEKPKTEADLKSMTFAESAIIVAVDSVTDPQNMGSIFRIANGLGASALILPQHNIAPITAVVRKVASGAVETLPWFQVTNLSRTLNMMKEEEFWVVGADGNDRSKTIPEYQFPKKTILVLGAEGSGIRPGVRQNCDEFVAIPMLGQVESLNVASAASILLFEFARQQLLKIIIG